MRKKLNILFIISLIFGLTPSLASASTDSVPGYFTEPAQNVTAYTASQYITPGVKRYTASNKLPTDGIVAMKKSTIDARVPFGSQVVTPQLITNYSGYTTDTYYLQDSGVDPTLTTYAIDIWWGFCRTDAYSSVNLGCSTSDATYKSAKLWGKPPMNLKFYTNSN
ncbi:hypothetical protein ACFVR2_22875 [Gottfriedia sp. NPDC057991]|uniref:hypothetical protein n=1 Tax=Gottfriedia sp. NPDC057991 TaxID=3346298 RepID=UPI0036DF503B